MKSSEAQGTGMAGVNLKTSKAQASEMCWSAYFCYRAGYEKQKDSYIAAPRACSRPQDWNISGHAND